MGLPNSIVMKFGGTSVQDAASMLRVGEVVRTRLSQSPVIVVSALAGVTDALIDCAQAAAKGERKTAIEGLHAIAFRHRSLIENLISVRAAAIQQLMQSIQDLKSLLEGVAALRELTMRSLDAILAFGERLSSRILCAAMCEQHLPAEWIDAADIIATNNQYGNADFVFDSAKADALLRPLLERGRIPVLPGFTGRSSEGFVTTLGRGGSDTSAVIIAALLRLKEVEIWTDVSGLYSADPRHIPEAVLLPQVTYDQALELAHFGARVIHPGAVALAREHGIPLRIMNTFHPVDHGTLIDSDGNGNLIAAVTLKKGLSVVPFVSVERMSKQSPLLVYSGTADGSVHAVLQQRCESNPVALITIVASAVVSTVSMISRIYQVLAGASIRILGAVHGARNVSLIIGQQDADSAARVIHRALLSEFTAATQNCL